MSKEREEERERETLSKKKNNEDIPLARSGIKKNKREINQDDYPCQEFLPVEN